MLQLHHFILDLTPGFTGMGKDNWKTRESFGFGRTYTRGLTVLCFVLDLAIPYSIPSQEVLGPSYNCLFHHDVIILVTVRAINALKLFLSIHLFMLEIIRYLLIAFGLFEVKVWNLDHCQHCGSHRKCENYVDGKREYKPTSVQANMKHSWKRTWKWGKTKDKVMSYWEILSYKCICTESKAAKNMFRYINLTDQLLFQTNF